METAVVRTATDIGKLVRRTRVVLGLTQEQLAMAAGTGPRFLVDLEAGKATCELEKTLTVLGALGIRLELNPPAAVTSERPTVRRRRM